MKSPGKQFYENSKVHHSLITTPVLQCSLIKILKIALLETDFLSAYLVSFSQVGWDKQIVLAMLFCVINNVINRYLYIHH